MNAWLRARRRKTKHGETVTLACACGCKPKVALRLSYDKDSDLLFIGGVAAPRRAWRHALSPYLFDLQESTVTNTTLGR